MADQTAATKPEERKKRDGPVVVSVINLKGGVGKTTVTALLADYAVRMGLKVLAIDLDPQANLTQGLMDKWEYRTFMDPKMERKSIADVFCSYSGDGEKMHRDKVAASLRRWRIPTGDDTRGLLIPSHFAFADTLIRPLQETKERALADFVNEHKGDRELILIDCAPTESVLTRAAYRASDYILIPAKTAYLATIGFPLLRQSLEDFKKDADGHDIQICGVLINYIGTSTAAKNKERVSIRRKAAKYGWHVFAGEMEEAAGFEKWPTPEMGYLGTKYLKIFRPIAQDIMERLGLWHEQEEL
ncbi:MAG: ParA family protein [Gammaproteobacteria bacterium]